MVGGRGPARGSRIPERRRPVCGTPARSVESRRLRHNLIPSSFFNRSPSSFLLGLPSSSSFCFVPRTNLPRLYHADTLRLPPPSSPTSSLSRCLSSFSAPAAPIARPCLACSLSKCSNFIPTAKLHLVDSAKLGQPVLLSLWRRFSYDP